MQPILSVNIQPRERAQMLSGPSQSEAAVYDSSATQSKYPSPSGVPPQTLQLPSGARCLSSSLQQRDCLKSRHRLKNILQTAFGDCIVYSDCTCTDPKGGKQEVTACNIHPPLAPWQNPKSTDYAKCYDRNLFHLLRAQVPLPQYDVSF